MTAHLALNGQETTYPEGIADLEGLLQMVDNHALRAEIITDVRIDGKAFSEVYAHEAKDISLASLNNVAVHSCTPEVFSEAFLEQTAQYIDHLKSGFRLAVKLFRQGEETQEAGHDMLGRTLEAFGALKSHLENVRDVVEKKDGNTDITGLWQDFESVSDRLHQAQMDMAPERIASVLEAEVMPFLDTWKAAA